ncbi:MAG: helix-turn-helix domain containing protein [Magnetococcus sp. YQC-5]
MNAELKDPEFHQRLTELIGEEKPFSWAKRLGIHTTTFMRMWKDGSIPSVSVLLQIKEKTGVSIDWLLTGEETNTQQKNKSLSYYWEEYGEEFVFDMYEWAQNICGLNDPDEDTIWPSREELLDLALALCPIHIRRRDREAQEIPNRPQQEPRGPGRVSRPKNPRNTETASR